LVRWIMSQSGNIVLYTTKEPDDPRGLLAELFSLTGSNRVIYIQRTIGESREWQYYLEDRRLNSSTAILQPYEDSESPGNLQDLSISYKEGTSLDICVGTCPLGDRVEAAIHSNIDPTIRGGFCPAEVYLDIGYHDLFEDAENEDGLYIARPF